MVKPAKKIRLFCGSYCQLWTVLLLLFGEIEISFDVVVPRLTNFGQTCRTRRLQIAHEWMLARPIHTQQELERDSCATKCDAWRSKTWRVDAGKEPHKFVHCASKWEENLDGLD